MARALGMVGLAVFVLIGGLSAAFAAGKHKCGYAHDVQWSNKQWQMAQGHTSTPRSYRR